MQVKGNCKTHIKPFYEYETEKMEECKKSYDRKCPHCGYTNRIMNKYRRIPCKNCGTYVFLDKKEEFIYRVREHLC